MVRSVLRSEKRGIERGEVFGREYLEYITTDAGQSLSQSLNEKRWTASETNISSRVLNHWEELGLIGSTRLEGRGWRKFSVMDLVWIRTANELRLFGYPLEMLREAREYLSGQGWGPDTDSIVTFLEFYIVRALVRKPPTFLLVFSDGQAEPVDSTQYRVPTKSFAWADHIRIDLGLILKAILPEANLKPNLQPLPVNPVEMEFIGLLRLGSYDSLTGTLKGGQIEDLVVGGTLSENHFVELLKEKPYQEVTIRRHDGRIVTVKGTIMRKLTK
jgi:hypothetical protein